MAEKIDFSSELAQPEEKFGVPLDTEFERVYVDYSLGKQKLLGAQLT